MEPCNRSGMTRATIRPPSRADAAQLDKAVYTYDGFTFTLTGVSNVNRVPLSFTGILGTDFLTLNMRLQAARSAIVARRTS